MTNPEVDKETLQKAARLLARRSYSLGDLRKKLAVSIAPDDLDRVLERLQALNLLNDSDYAYNFALRQMTEGGKGSLKVKEELLQHNVPESVVVSALDKIEQEFGEEHLLRAYFERQTRKTGPPKDTKSLRKFILLLRRRGFSETVIRRVLRDQVPSNVLHLLEIGE